MKTYQGIIVDAISKKQFKGEIVVENGKSFVLKRRSIIMSSISSQVL
jgi:adenine deaminase